MVRSMLNISINLHVIVPSGKKTSETFKGNFRRPSDVVGEDNSVNDNSVE